MREKGGETLAHNGNTGNDIGFYSMACDGPVTGIQCSQGNPDAAARFNGKVWCEKVVKR